MNVSGQEQATAGLDCPEFTEKHEAFLLSFSFWVEGTLSCCIAITGFFGNIGSSYVLSQKEMRNSFNLLLIALACFDNAYLFCGVLDSFRKNFNLGTRLHIVLFPYLFYPLQSIAMTGSIFMTVAIALERYTAVHYPVNYSQAVNDESTLRQRLVKYLLPVCLLSVLFNVTKFFEATYEYEEENIMNVTANGGTIETPWPVLKPTSLRMDPIYSIYFNWFRFLVVGVIPFLLLVLLYAKIYADIQDRRKRTPAFRQQQQSQQSGTNGTKRQWKVFLTGPKRSFEQRQQQIETSVMPQTGDNNAEDQKPTPPPPRTAAVNIGSRRRMEDQLASIFMGYILVFLICHSPRVMLNIYELVTIRAAVACTSANKQPFPPWSLAITGLSQLLLVLNSSINILVYCAMSSKFRTQCVRLFQQAAKCTRRHVV